MSYFVAMVCDVNKRDTKRQVCVCDSQQAAIDHCTALLAENWSYTFDIVDDAEKESRIKARLADVLRDGKTAQYVTHSYRGYSLFFDVKATDSGVWIALQSDDDNEDIVVVISEDE